MEGAPLFNQEDDSDDNPDIKPSRKSEDDKSKYAGIFSYEAKPPEPDVKPVEKIEKPEPKPRIAELSVAEIEPAPETEAPLEKLGEEEKPIIERELTIAAQETDPVQAPEQVTDPEQAAAEQAVEHFRDLIVEDGEDSDDAFRETLAELGAEEDEINDLVEEIEPSLEDDIEDDNEEDLEEEPDTDVQEFGDEELVIDRSGEDAPEDNEDTDDSADSGSGGSGSGQPPVTPPPTTPPPPAGQPPHGFGGANGPNPPFGNGPQGGFNPNQTPPTSPVVPDEAPRVEVEYRGNPAAAALVGGVLGYLLGRRRGRIRTEKKLLPVQKKLEKQVNGLEFQLQEKEKTLRRVAAEKVRQQGPIVIERLANVAEKEPKKQEHLGHVSLSAAEVEPLRHPEKRRSKLGIVESRAHEQSQAATGKRVENLSRDELLRLSEQIIIEGTSLRQIYETHLINERGMRRIVAENLRGGDLNKALRREIVEREVDFERDPALRDVVPQVSGGGAHGGPNKQALNDLLKAADVAISDGSEEAAFFRARAKFEANQLAQHQKQRQLFNIGFAAIVAILMTIIAILFVSRG